MKLNALPCRDPQRAVGIGVADMVEREILLGRKAPAGDADADHELIVLGIARLFQLGRAIAVIPLINPVEF